MSSINKFIVPLIISAAMSSDFSNRSSVYLSEKAEGICKDIERSCQYRIANKCHKIQKCKFKGSER